MFFYEQFVNFCVNLASGCAFEACGATSWRLEGSKSEFLMNFGGSRASFWRPGGTLGGVMGPLVDPKCLQNASPKPQNSKKTSSEKMSNQNHQKMKLRIWFFNDFLMFFVWRLNVFFEAFGDDPRHQHARTKHSFCIGFYSVLCTSSFWAS